jgi:hypothetical protein
LIVIATKNNTVISSGCEGSPSRELEKQTKMN